MFLCTRTRQLVWLSFRLLFNANELSSAPAGHSRAQRCACMVMLTLRYTAGGVGAAKAVCVVTVEWYSGVRAEPPLRMPTPRLRASGSRAALQVWAAGQAANCCASCIALIALVFGMMFGLRVVCALVSHDNASSPQTLLCIRESVLVRCVRSSQQAVRATIDDGHTALPERELCDGRV